MKIQKMQPLQVKIYETVTKPVFFVIIQSLNQQFHRSTVESAKNNTRDPTACAKINYHHNLFGAWKIVRFWRQTVEVIDGNSSFVWTCSTLICILNDARNNRQQRVLNCFISSNDKYLRPKIFSDWRRRRPVNQSSEKMLVSEVLLFLKLSADELFTIQNFYKSF